MCLYSKWTKKEIDEWLKEQPDIITAYKVVNIINRGDRETAYPPFFFDIGEYRKTNIVESEEDEIFADLGGKYVPNFHLFLTKDGADYWSVGISHVKTLKCEIPKNQITSIGTQGSKIATTIVTKEFTFVEGEQFFTEKEK